MAAYKDYYQVLGVDRQATDEEIKTAYRKLARQYHPDLHQGEGKKAAEEKFKEVNEANEVLGDPEKRATYDQLGSGFRDGQEWQPPSGNGFQHYTWSNADSAGSPFTGTDFSDFFETLFGRGNGHATKGQDLEAEIALSLEDAFRGVEKIVQLTSGKTLTVKIPPGTIEGNKIRLKGQGYPGARGGQPGDLYLRIKYLPNSHFQLQDYDLETQVELRPEQAVLGDKVSVTTLDGTVLLTIPPLAKSGQKMRLRAKGWPRRNGIRGDLYVKLGIVIPENLSPAEIELYQKIRKLKQGGEA